MGSLKHTIKLVKKVLNDDTKASMYSDEELMYMRRQLGEMKEQRRLKKLHKKSQQGFLVSDNLMPPKARILLMLGLTQTNVPSELQQFFYDF